MDNKPQTYEPSGFALQIFKDRYAIYSEETFQEACHRVANFIASAEDGEKIKEFEKRFFDIMSTNKFSPGGRIWRGANRKKPAMMNCFVLPSEDSREGWAELLKEVTIISGLGGGIGISFDNIRPRGTEIKGTGGIATGAVSLMKIVNGVCNELREGGGRRSALLFGLGYWHPDIEEFLNVKLDKKELNNANISILVDDKFFDLVESDGDIELKWQDKIIKTIKAKWLYNKVIENSLKTGDPGFLNLGHAKKMNNLYYCREQTCSNPSMPSGTLILTREGIIPIEQLENKSFRTKNINNEWVEAKCFLSGENEEIFELNFGGNKKTYSTQKHKWPVLDNHGRINNVETGNLKPKDKILAHQNRPLGINGNNNLTEEEGFFVGMLLGDGWITQRKTGEQINKFAMGFVFNENDKYLAEKILSFINQRKNSVSSITKRKQRLTDKCWYINTTNQTLINEIMDKYGFDKTKQRIPSCVWKSNDNFIKGFIDGLFSADGSIGEKSILLTSSRTSLIKDISKLLSFYGIYGSYTSNKIKASFPNGITGIYNICRYSTGDISEFNNIFKLSHKEKQFKLDNRTSNKKFKLFNGYQYLLLKEIKSYATGKVWDISVNSNEHIFPADYSYTGNCGEQILAPHSVCCLGAINLSTHVKENGEINWALLDDTIRLSVRFLDNVIDKNEYPLEIIKEISQKERRIGLGIMGLHDMFLKMGIKYNSEKALEATDKVMSFIKKKSYDSSIFLAVEKSQFRLLDREKFIQSGFCQKALTPALRKKILEYGIRNCFLLTIAPTGTTSIVAGCSSGIEPMFAPVYKRNFNRHKDFHATTVNQSTEIVIHPLLKKFIEENKDYSHFEGAHEISPEQHCKIQKMCQKHLDNSVSKTINLPENSTEDNLSNIILKYIRNLNGMTIYKDGSKGTSPIEPLPIEEAKKYLNECVVKSTDNSCPNGKCEI